MSRVINFNDSDTKAFNIIFLIFGIISFLVASHFYSKFLHSQYIHTNIDRNVRILNCRLGIIIPVYGLLFLGILIVPHYWNFFEVGISFVEGYCIYCFNKMLAFRVGSRTEVVELIKESDYTRPCCASCQKKTPNCCYSVIEMLLIQFFTLRPFLFLLIAFIEEAGHHGPIIQVLSISTTISLIIAMIGLLRSYNFMSGHTKGLLPAQKVLFIKAIILLMVIQNLVVSSQQETGVFAKGHGNQEEDNVEKFDSSRRWYAAVGIIETFLFSLLMERIFKIHDNDEMRESLNALAREAPSGTYTRFVMDILKLWTVIWVLPPTPVLIDQSQQIPTSNPLGRKSVTLDDDTSLNGV